MIRISTLSHRLNSIETRQRGSVPQHEGKPLKVLTDRLGIACGGAYEGAIHSFAARVACEPITSSDRSILDAVQAECGPDLTAQQFVAALSSVMQEMIAPGSLSDDSPKAVQ